MKKIYSVLISFLFITFITSVSSSSAFAYHVKRVLGTSTQQLVIPPTVEGPGLILPESQWYFLDNLKQQARLFIAFTPEMKAQTYTDIAGERYAEARFELSKGNTSAAMIALEGVRDNTKLAAINLADAQFKGKNVTKIAYDINLSIKRHQQVFDTLSAIATGEMKAEIDVVNATLSDAKDVVENSLAEAELQNEIRYDLNRNITLLAQSTSTAAKDLQLSIAVLQQEASIAAKNNQPQRELALKGVIEEKSAEAKKLSTDSSKKNYALQPQAAVAAAQIVQSAEDFAKQISAQK